MFRKDASAVGYVRSTSRRRLWPSNMAVFLMQAPTMLSAPGGTATLGCAENYQGSGSKPRRQPRLVTQSRAPLRHPLRASQPKASLQVVWVRKGNCRKTALLSVFDSIFLQLEAALQAGDHLIEIR
jgi:hypothetical protein